MGATLLLAAWVGTAAQAAGPDLSPAAVARAGAARVAPSPEPNAAPSAAGASEDGTPTPAGEAPAGGAAPSPSGDAYWSRAATVPGPSLGDDLRYPDTNLLFRFGHDLVAIPSGILRWSGEDWGVFTAWATPVLLLMLGPSPSWDAQLQFWLRDTLPQDRFRLWNTHNDVIMWSAIWMAIAGTLGVGWFGDLPDLVETVSLMLEAFALAQVGQWIFKLPLGREGPKNGDGLGLIKGPAAAWAMIPAGTPSGHAATLYAMMGVVMVYWDNPWVTAALHVFGAFFSTMLVVDDYHFLSDVIWGASMGWYFGQWVVRHRSSRFGYAGAEPVRLTLMPTVDPEGGRYALTLSVRF